MKWKRSKKAQQEAKAKAAADRHAKANGLSRPIDDSTKNDKSKRIPMDEDEMSSDHDEEDIDVGEDSNPMMSPLVTPTPILGLPHPPALQLRPLMPHPQMQRPPFGVDTSVLDHTSLSALLPAHLARLSGGANRLYRPFVA
jgi:hypothetical protein